MILVAVFERCAPKVCFMGAENRPNPTIDLKTRIPYLSTVSGIVFYAIMPAF